MCIEKNRGLEISELAMVHRQQAWKWNPGMSSKNDFHPSPCSKKGKWAQGSPRYPHRRHAQLWLWGCLINLHIYYWQRRKSERELWLHHGSLSPLSADNLKHFFPINTYESLYFHSVLCTSGLGSSLLNHVSCGMGPGDKNWLPPPLDSIVCSVIESSFSTEALSFESHLIRLWHSSCTNFSLGVSLRSTLKSLVTSFMDRAVTQAQSCKTQRPKPKSIKPQAQTICTHYD